MVPGAGVSAPVIAATAPTDSVERREYHELWRVPGYAWWQGLVALGLVGALSVAVIVAAAIPLVFHPDRLASAGTTPLVFVLNNVFLALWIPFCLLTAWGMTGQRPGWLMSVTGRMRWGWLWRCVGLTLLLWVPLNAASYVIELLAGRNPVAGWAIGPDTGFLLAGVLLTTAFQSAGRRS